MRIKSGISAFFITGAILLAAFFMGGLFPFGYDTVSWCDMNQQAIPLLCDFKDILAGKSGFFFNSANAAGMNFYGVFFFFLSSPFSFLAAFVDKADIPFLMNILVILKLCLTSFTAAYSFGKLFPKLSIGLNVALGVSYSLCGYGMLFYQNIMWLDIMYLFPIVILGAYKLVKEDKPLVLLISLSATIVLNYYISFMVFLFVIFSFGIFALVYRRADRKIYVNLGFCGIFSLLITAVVWVPSFLQYTASGRGSGVLAELTGSGFFAVTDTTVPVLLCNGIIFAAFLFIIPKLSVTDSHTRFLCLLFSALSIPLIVEPVNLMWHTGSYMSFPARYGFMTVFAGLLIAAKEISDTKTTEKNNKNAIIICLMCVSALTCFMIGFTEENIETLSSYVGALWGNEYSFKGLILLCGIAVAAYFIVLLCLKKRLLTRRIAALLLCLVVAAEGFCSVKIYMITAKGRMNLYNYQSFLQLDKAATKEGFYRVNTSHKLIDANMTGASGFNTISHYTSLNDKITMEAAKQLGYSGYWMETGNWGGSIISDALLSVGYTVNKVENNFRLEENPYFLGLGIKTERDIPESLSHSDRLMNSGEAFATMTNSKNAVTKYEPRSLESCNYYKYAEGDYAIYTKATGTITYKITVKDRQTLYFDCYNGFSNNLTEEINDSFEIYVNGELLASPYPTQRQNGLLRLGSFENCKVNITLSVLKNCECSSFGVFGIDEETVANAVKNTKCLNLKADKSKLYGKAEAGKYFISIPYSENYKITLNGKNIDYTKALSGFVAIDIAEAGELEITSVPKGFVFGLVISILSIILAALLLKFEKATIISNSNFKNIVYGIFLGVFAIAVLSVYIIPVFVNLSDLRL